MPSPEAAKAGEGGESPNGGDGLKAVWETGLQQLGDPVVVSKLLGLI